EKQELVSLFQKNEENINNTQNNQGLSNAGRVASGYTVDKHGNIRLPYIGEMNVLGYTTKEVRLKFEETISSYFTDLGNIFVTVNLAGIKYTILGEVGNPGSKILYDNSITILDAISNSGDIPVTGNRKE